MRTASKGKLLNLIDRFQNMSENIKSSPYPYRLRDLNVVRGIFNLVRRVMGLWVEKIFVKRDFLD